MPAGFCLVDSAEARTAAGDPEASRGGSSSKDDKISAGPAAGAGLRKGCGKSKATGEARPQHQQTVVGATGSGGRGGSSGAPRTTRTAPGAVGKKGSAVVGGSRPLAAAAGVAATGVARSAEPPANSQDTRNDDHQGSEDGGSVGGAEEGSDDEYILSGGSDDEGSSLSGDNTELEESSPPGQQEPETGQVHAPVSATGKSGELAESSLSVDKRSSGGDGVDGETSRQEQKQDGALVEERRQQQQGQGQGASLYNTIGMGWMTALSASGVRGDSAAGGFGTQRSQRLVCPRTGGITTPPASPSGLHTKDVNSSGKRDRTPSKAAQAPSSKRLTGTQLNYYPK